MAQIPTELPLPFPPENPPPHFPDDILIQIFLKLPPRPLFLFKSVSKHWLSLIQNPTFIHHHINTNKLRLDNHVNKNSLLVMRNKNHSKIVFTLLSDDQTLPYQEDVPLEAISPSMASRNLCLEDGRLHLLGPCNGLFCVTDTADIVVFNPATKQCRNVARSPLSSRRKEWYGRNYVGFFDRVGFGFDHVENDYKVVWFHDVGVLKEDYNDHDGADDSYDDEDDDDSDDYPYAAICRNLLEKFTKANAIARPEPDIEKDDDEEYDDDEGYDDYDDDYDDDDDDDDYPHDRLMKVEIFSLGTNCWREIDSVIPAFEPIRVRSHNLFFNGAFHWLGGGDENVCSILVFDLNKEAFKEFDLPDTYEDAEDINVYLSVVNESLGMIVHREEDYNEIDVEYEIWVMRKYGVSNSWRQLYSISFDVGIKRPLSFGKKRELLVEIGDGQLASFNPKTKKIKKFQVLGVRKSVHAFRYTESLVSPY